MWNRIPLSYQTNHDFTYIMGLIAIFGHVSAFGVLFGVGTVGVIEN